MKIMQALAVATVVGAGVAAAADAPAGKTWIELRKYTFASVEKRQAFEAYLGSVAVNTRRTRSSWAGAPTLPALRLFGLPNRDHQPLAAQ